MKILCVIPFYKPAYIYGGPARSMPALLEGLADIGVDATVYTTNANGENNLRVKQNHAYHLNGVHVYYFNRILSKSIFRYLVSNNISFNSYFFNHCYYKIY